jgi:hypothetical protein
MAEKSAVGLVEEAAVMISFLLKLGVALGSMALLFVLGLVFCWLFCDDDLPID